MAGRLPEINREFWELRGATDSQFQHVEQDWQDCRKFPDRSGSMAGRDGVLGLGGFSTSDCPLARLRLGPPPPEPEPEVDLPIASPRTVAMYKELFERHDYDGSGQIETKELANLFRELGREVSEVSMKIMIQQIDHDGSGEVDFTEFLEGCFGVRERRPGDPAPISEHQKAYNGMCESIAKDDFTTMRILLEKHGVDGWEDEGTGLDIMHVAAQRGCEAMVSLLIEMKADPNKPCADGRTPLHFASESSHRDRSRSLQVLLSAGANATSRDSIGYTPINGLTNEYKGSGFEWIDNPEIMERFHYHRKKHHHAHGYHPMLAIADLVGESKPKHKHKHHHHHHGEEGKHHHHHHHHGEEGRHHHHHHHGEEGKHHHHRHAEDGEHPHEKKEKKKKHKDRQDHTDPHQHRSHDVDDEEDDYAVRARMGADKHRQKHR